MSVKRDEGANDNQITQRPVGGTPWERHKFRTSRLEETDENTGSISTDGTDYGEHVGGADLLERSCRRQEFAVIGQFLAPP